MYTEGVSPSEREAPAERVGSSMLSPPVIVPLAFILGMNLFHDVPDVLFALPKEIFSRFMFMFPSSAYFTASSGDRERAAASFAKIEWGAAVVSAIKARAMQRLILKATLYAAICPPLRMNFSCLAYIIAKWRQKKYP